MWEKRESWRNLKLRFVPRREEGGEKKVFSLCFVDRLGYSRTRERKMCTKTRDFCCSGMRNLVKHTAFKALSKSLPGGDGDVIILDGALSLPFFSHRGKRGKSQPKGAFFPFLFRLISCPHPGRHGEKPSPSSSKGEPLEQLLLEDKGVKNFSRCIAKGNTMGISRGNRANFPKKVELLHPLSLKKNAGMCIQHF